MEHYTASKILPIFHFAPYRAALSLQPDLLNLYDRRDKHTWFVAWWMDGGKKDLQMPPFCDKTLLPDKRV